MLNKANNITNFGLGKAIQLRFLAIDCIEICSSGNLNSMPGISDYTSYRNETGKENSYRKLDNK